MDKLQELTQKLYNEGLSKGKEEGEALLAQAKTQAEEIVKSAQEQAQAILAKAQKEAADFQIKVEGDVKMAAIQALQTTKASIENLIVAKASNAAISDALTEEAYIKGIITAVAQHFSTQESTDISLVLPETLQKGLEPFVKNELGKVIGKGVEASFNKKISGGFKIGPKDGSYFIDLTDQSFQQLIGAYLRPATKKILFG